MKDTPVGEVLNGLTITELEDGAMPVDAIILVKTLNSDGAPRWALRTTDGVNEVEVIGALTVVSDYRRQHFVNGWESDGD
jgi:hypothetical protein